jgi:hypothetical protein
MQVSKSFLLNGTKTHR